MGATKLVIDQLDYTIKWTRSVKRDLEDFKHVLVSNSLSLRKEWFKAIGGTGFLPTEAKRGRAKEHEPVYLIGSEILNPVLWSQIISGIQG